MMCARVQTPDRRLRGEATDEMSHTVSFATAALGDHRRNVPFRRRLGRLMVAACLAAAASTITARANAEPPPAEGKHRLVWTYPRFRPWQYTATIGVVVTGFYIEKVSRDFSPKTEWRGILFDDAVRNALVSTNKDTRESVARISDYMWNATQYYPVIVDSLLVPLLTDKLNVDVASQMLLMDMQVQSLTFFILRIGHRAIGRERPSVQECAANKDYDGACANPDGAHASFFGGHAAMAFSGAALTCSHHAALPLYGSSFGGALACGVTMTSATVTSVMRIVADKHWTTDILFGSGVGLGLGFALPYLLHYGPHLRVKQGSNPIELALLPIVSTNTTGLSIFGAH
jgi:hypothetical protein